MRQDTILAMEVPLVKDKTSADGSKPAETDRLIRGIRSAAKRRRRLFAWIAPLIAIGMVSTIFVFSRVDIRLSLIIFAVSAILVAAALARKASQWERLAERAVELGDVRAIGPLLTVLNDRDTGACETIEGALILLLPRVERLSPLSRMARRELNRLLLEFEMPGLRGGHNADLARTALETVARFRDCSSLPAVRRLAEGFTATRPSAAIRDLANDILPDLEERAALLRPSQAESLDNEIYIRAAGGSAPADGADYLVRPTAADTEVDAATAGPNRALELVAGREVVDETNREQAQSAGIV